MNIEIKNSDDLLAALEPFKINREEYFRDNDIYRIAGHRSYINIGLEDDELFIKTAIQYNSTTFYSLCWRYSIEDFVVTVGKFGFTPNKKDLNRFMLRPPYVEEDKENELFEELINLVTDVGIIYRFK